MNASIRIAHIGQFPLTVRGNKVLPTSGGARGLGVVHGRLLVHTEDMKVLAQSSLAAQTLLESPSVRRLVVAPTSGKRGAQPIPDESLMIIIFQKPLLGLRAYDGTPITFGRGRSHQGRLLDIGVSNDFSQVSRNHMELKCSDDHGWLIRDVSQRGTFLNGTAVAPNQWTPVKAGDTVTLGGFGKKEPARGSFSFALMSGAAEDIPPDHPSAAPAHVEPLAEPGPAGPVHRFDYQPDFHPEMEKRFLDNRSGTAFTLTEPPDRVRGPKDREGAVRDNPLAPEHIEQAVGCLRDSYPLTEEDGPSIRTMILAAKRDYQIPAGWLGPREYYRGLPSLKGRTLIKLIEQILMSGRRTYAQGWEEIVKGWAGMPQTSWQEELDAFVQHEHPFRHWPSVSDPFAYCCLVALGVATRRPLDGFIPKLFYKPLKLLNGRSLAGLESFLVSQGSGSLTKGIEQLLKRLAEAGYNLSDLPHEMLAEMRENRDLLRRSRVPRNSIGN